MARLLFICISLNLLICHSYLLLIARLASPYLSSMPSRVLATNASSTHTQQTDLEVKKAHRRTLGMVGNEDWQVRYRGATKVR